MTTLARRRPLTPRRLLLLPAVLLLFLLAPACTLTVRPPARPHDPVTVWIVDHGRHASLALPDGKGHLVAWAYGEDAWFARNQDGFWRIVPAMLWSTRGTLGRRQVTESTSGHLLAWTLDAEWIWQLEVPRERAAELQHELQSLFDAGYAEQIDNPTYKARFAPHPAGYWLGHTCIDELEEWLEALGCEVSGFAFTAKFDVRGAAAQPRSEELEAEPLYRGPSPAPPDHQNLGEPPPPPATLEEAIEETFGGRP